MVEGIKVVSDILRESLMTLDTIYATDEWIASSTDLLHNYHGEITPVTRDALAKVSGFKSPQPVLAVGTPPDLVAPLDAHQHTLCLYLDGIGDPGNLGTILRIADWFGLGNVYLSQDCADIHNPKTIQASMSSVFRVRTNICELADLDADAVVGATMQGSPLQTIAPMNQGILVLGSESHGIRPGCLEFCRAQVVIPSDRSLGAESLNVAAASAILCAHLTSGQVQT